MAVQSATKRIVKDNQSSGNNSHKFRWKIRCDSPLDTTWTVYTSASNPKKGSTPPAECGPLPAGYVALDDGDVQPMGDSPYWFTMDVEYGVPAFGASDNPLAIVQKWGGGADLFRSISRDLDGEKLENAAGVYIDPLPEVPCNAGSFGLTIRTQNLTLYTTISHKVNSAAIWGLPARTVKIGRVGWRMGSESSVKFWEIDIPMDYNEDTWDLIYDNVGFEEEVSGNLRKIRLADGSEPSLPEPLSDVGVWAPGTTPGAYTSRLYKMLNFASLSLPNPFTLT